MHRLKPGTVFWITGFAGAGKSTIANETLLEIKKHHQNVLLIDGDAFRSIFQNDLGHSSEDRLANAWRIARFAKFLSDQDQIVLCATVSLYEEVRSWLRANCPESYIIYVRVLKETLLARDQKGLYSGALKGTISEVAGINQEVSIPKNPDLILDNDESRLDYNDFVTKILSLTIE